MVVRPDALDASGLAHPEPVGIESNRGRRGLLWSRFSTRSGTTGVVIDEHEHPNVPSVRKGEYTGD